jgi:hypothetical protein
MSLLSLTHMLSKQFQTHRAMVNTAGFRGEEEEAPENAEEKNEKLEKSRFSLFNRVQ